MVAGNSSAPTVLCALGFYPFNYVIDGSVPTFSTLSPATIADTRGGILCTTGGQDRGPWVPWPSSSFGLPLDQAISNSFGAILFAYNATGSPYA